MGWVFLYDAPNKSDVVADCTRGSDTIKCIRKTTVGYELWTVWHNIKTNEKVIILFLLAKQNGNWGYKNMSEAMHPYFYKCPLSFLNEVPVSNQDWRNKVIDYHANQKGIKNISVGSVVKMRDSKPNEFRVTSLNPLLGVSCENGKTYKLIKARIVEIK